ncbi:MAG: ferric anguibactin-binding protein [Burkholderiales bacterium]|nr:MAG: ferric anguibactin-binding protein [Burkholderiales bacterium]
MNLNHPRLRWAAALALLAATAMPAAAQALAAPAPAAPGVYAPVTVQHKLGTTVIAKLPRRVAALDMNEVDFLDQLGVPVIGMPKDFVPDFLQKYRDAPDVQDLGSIVQPNMERVHAARPDLVLMTSLQANHYKELSEIAPTIQFDVDYRNSQTRHIEVIREHLTTLGQIFGKQELALGVKPAGPAAQTGLHGQPVSSEFIQQANPDIVYVIDRTAVMQRRPVMDAKSMGNPLLQQTNAWKNGRVVFVDPQAWYVMGASPTSLAIVIDDVLKGYRN